MNSDRDIGAMLIHKLPYIGLEAMETLHRKARVERSRQIWSLFVSIGNWVERTVWRARQRELSTYLSRATDHADLERRMRSLQNGSPSLG